MDGVTSSAGEPFAVLKGLNTIHLEEKPIREL